MKLSELESKQVINIDDGTYIGNIVDVSIDEGHLVKFILEKKKFILSLFIHKYIDIDWNNIVKIGDDVILVHKDT